jgi:hypothetical protein
VLAAFCWTKSLLCNVAAFTGMLIYPQSTLQLCSSRRFCEVFKDLFRFPVSRPDDVVFCPDAHQSATSIRTTRSFHPDAHQCLEASNSFEWQIVLTLFRVREDPNVPVHPSGRHGYTVWMPFIFLTSIRVSASRYIYGKTAATVRTMCDPVRTKFSLRQERVYQVQ